MVPHLNGDSRRFDITGSVVTFVENINDAMFSPDDQLSWVKVRGEGALDLPELHRDGHFWCALEPKGMEAGGKDGFQLIF